ncbi:MAG: CpaF family protein [Deltaproteobacteria bacterium]|nr:CpaF family protein [Deltaproteobacteria bacterium]
MMGVAATSGKAQAGGAGVSGYHELKGRVHERVIEVLDLSAAAALDEESLKRELGRLIQRILTEEQVPLNMREKEQLVVDIQNEVLGYGPLEPLLNDPTVSDILVNNYRMVYVERAGKLQKTDIRFRDDLHLRKIIDRIVSGVGRRIDESMPMVDARLPDGSRVNAIIPPLALDGPAVSIRKFSRDPLQLGDLINKKSLTPEIGEILQRIVKARLNVIISGGTGCGKTTILNILSGFIPEDERIVTIEDSAELQLRQDHVVRLETRPPNVEGRGEITQRELVKNCLRMRPDRIILGEIRSGEALDMLQAMNTGHDGSLTTIHANTPRDALTRIETMVAMAGLNLPTKAMRHYIASAINVIIQMTRLSDGTRKLTSLAEVTGMEGEVVTINEVFSFQQTGLDAQGRVRGRFGATGIRPKFMAKFETLGLFVPPDLFNPNRVYEI